MKAEKTLPSEFRSLLDSNQQKRGCLEMLMYVVDGAEDDDAPPLQLSHLENEPVELRVVVWCSRGLKLVEGQRKMDVFVRCMLDCNQYMGVYPRIQNTDVHYGCSDGKTTYSWRCVYPNIQSPLESCVLQLAAFQHESLGDGTLLGEANIQLLKWVSRTANTRITCELDSELDLTIRGQQGISTTTGYLQVSVRILVQQQAQTKPVGLGRNSPNRDPWLFTPQAGRRWTDAVPDIDLGFAGKGTSLALRGIFIIMMLLFLVFIAVIYPGLFM